jgi:glyoxylase-like metal-dependent hydrolase (beta-lactamase superfamily II)
VAGLGRAGFKVDDVHHVFLSHIHFDHAGAAWRFSKTADVYVHPRGAPHLIDPAKLIESATRIFGDDMERLWGKIAPVPQDRVKILQDNEVVRVGQFEIRAIATPGHASHHHVYHWDDNVFGGDIAGVRIGAGPPIPPFVPPELHIESWIESIHKIRAVNPTNLYLPHFGKVDGSIPDHLDALEERVTRWSQWFLEKIRTPKSEIRNEDLAAAFAEYEHADILAFAGPSTLNSQLSTSSALVPSYEAADPSYMAVPAAIRYWQKYHPEQIN